MPISDEVIELAPVKKTKKTLIIMIAGMGVLFALAVAFLVMYLVKPSVTEDKNHVKDITLVSNELFSETTQDGQVKYYASIGNEYTVYSTLTVDNNSSTNVQWDFDPALIEIKEQVNSGEPHLTFIPREGMHNRTAKITVRAPSQVSEYKTVEFIIVNQGAEDIQVTQYGVRNNLTTVQGDSIQNDLSITVPYYTMDKSANNQSIQVKFNQISKYNPTTGEYLKPTSIVLNGVQTDGVTVASSDETVISVNEDMIDNNGFSFTVKKSSNEYVTLTITANVNNSNFAEITKTIKVKVDSNISLGYVDSMYVFNKPIVNAEFAGKVLDVKNKAGVDSEKLEKEIKNDKSLKVTAYNDRKIQLNSSSDFALVLPYSNNNSITYNDIFKHVLLNPLNIQYNGDEIDTAWYKDIRVTSSDTNVLVVTQESNGNVKLYPKNVSGLIDGKVKCNLTFKDVKTGSAGASITVPVRIVAQNTEIELAHETNKTTAEKPDIEVMAAVNSTYDINVTYTFIAPNRDKAETLLEEHCLNNAYRLAFDKTEMDVKLKGETKALEPSTADKVTEYSAAFTLTKVANSSGASTRYTATLTFAVTVKKDTTGAAVFKFIKNGSELYGTDDNNSLKSKDKDFELSASFEITESATRAWIIKDVDEEGKPDNTALNIVTENGTFAGYFDRKSDTEAWIYVQNRGANTELSIVSPSNVKQFAKADKSYFEVKNVKSVARGGLGLLWSSSTEKLSFAGINNFGSGEVGSVTFDVYNNKGVKIATLAIKIYIIDAVTDIVPVKSKPFASYMLYDSTTSGSVRLDENDVKVVRSYNTTASAYAYTNVNLYYGNDIAFSKTANGNGVYTFAHEGKDLYRFETSTRTLSTLDDIYAYSYEKEINFGNVELEFLLNDNEEYIGKNYDQEFVYDKDKRMKLEFVRKADNAALFEDSDYQSEVSYNTTSGFAVSVNQDTEAFLYATSVVNITATDKVYVEKDAKGSIAPVQKATFSVPTGITPSTFESSSAGRYYNITYRSPKISEQYRPYDGGFVYYSGKQVALSFTVNNVTRNITSIGIYSDSGCAADKSLSGKQILLGGFINEANKYTYTVYVKVVYEGHQSSFTSFEGVEFSLPSYLKLNGKTATVDSNGDNVYTLLPSTYSSDKGEETFICTIVVDKDEALTNRKTVKVVPSRHKDDGSKTVICTADVQAGLKTLYVKNGDATLATVTAGNTGKYATTFPLKNRSDIKSLDLSFEYEATNSEGYGLAYDHTGAGLKVAAPTSVSGFALTDNIKSAQSAFTISITDVITDVVTGEQTFIFTFTDEYNGANANNVFTLEVEITVTMDIYELAFADNTNATVTVTGESTGKQTLNITVVYNDNATATQPVPAIMQDNSVLGVYVLNGSDYDEFTDGIAVIHNAKDSAKYTVEIDNNIDRTQTYYLLLKYGNVTYNRDKHLCEITINTLTSHIEFDGGNTIRPTSIQGESCPSASIVVQSTSDEFTLVANVVNDGSGRKESGKTVNYGLYTDLNCTTAATGFTIDNGIITAANPAQISGTIYYRAQYTEANTAQKYTLKVKLMYTVAPYAVNISGVDTNAFSVANDTLTLYYDNAANYSKADLRGKIVASTAFSSASYNAANKVVYSVELQNSTDSAYLDVNGYVLTPKALNGNAETTVPVVVTATYAGRSVTKPYNVLIKPIADLTLTADNDTLNLLNRDSQLVLTPTIGTYSGFTPSYNLSASTTDNGVFAITGSDNEKTVKLLYGTNTKKGTYTLTANLSYTYAAGTGDGITVVGTFASTATYTVKVEGNYALTFDLVSGADAITPYDKTEATKYPVVDTKASYSLKVTSNDADFDVTYSATRTPAIVTIAEFSGKTATVSLLENASGAFAITVTATVGGETYTETQNYYFMYGANVVAKLYMSANNGSYSEFANTTQSIDYAAAPYKFKYEITGVPGDATVNLVVNGNVTKDELQIDGTTRYCEITATKPTTMRIGASVEIGSRKIYLEDKTVTLTATAPDFTLASGDTVLPSETLELSVNKAAGFQGSYTVSYAILSGDAYAKISGSTLTAEKNVVTDQTVIVRATITVNNGVYRGEYTVDKSITVTGVALPTISWYDSANKDLCLKDKDNYSYSAGDYSFDDNNSSYSYDSKVSVAFDAADGTLVKGVDFSFDASTGKLTLSNTAKTRAGGSIQLKVIATITSGAHQGESVTDTITVRVLPIMNTAASGITLGNAKATYDLNGDRFKSAFAPHTTSGDGFVQNGDSYAIVSLSVNDTTNFDVDGANLIVKNNLTAATTVNVTATVMISSGAYAGTTVVGTKAINIEVPSSSLAETVQWNDTDYRYNNITLVKDKVLGGDSDISGTVTGITVNVPTTLAEYVTVQNNGTSSPAISVSKNYGAYFTATAPEKKFTLTYVVSLEGGNVYYSTAEYTVVAQKVNISATLGGETVTENGTVSVNSGEILIMQLSADKRFDVVVTNVTVSASNLVTATYGGNGIQFDIGSVNSNQDVSVTLALNIAGQSITFEFGLTILAPLTNAQYTADNTEHTDFAVNVNNEIAQNNTVVSTWTAAYNARYKYAQSVTITAPSGHTLNEYFTSFKLNDSSAADLNGSSATINFPVSSWMGISRRILTESFNLNITFNTSAAIPLSTIEVKFTVYNSDNRGSAIDVIVIYRVQVIGAVSVTLNANSGDDNVQVNYTDPLYKHSYGLPTPTRTGYTLDGWYTAAQGGTEVAANAIVTSTQPHTLYARWTAKTYNLRYNANYTDAPAISVNKTVTYGQTYGELNTPTRAGYDFIGWTAASAANSQVITADTLVKPANANVATITLYAQWRILYYNVTLNAGDGTLDGTNKTMTAQVPYGGSFTLHNAIVPTRSGYRFAGWNASGSTSNVTGDVTLTAQWTQLYTVSFNANANGDVANPQSVQMANGDTYALPTLTRDGYDFDGWYNGANPVVSGDTATLTANVTLIAHWTQTVFTFTVTLDAGEGTIGGQNTYSFTVVKDAQFSTYLNITPERSGYHFDGWYIGNAKQESAITVTDDVELIAKWKKLYTVTFVNNGSDETPTAQQYVEGAEYDLPTLQDTDTKTFVGWSFTEGGEVIDGTSVVGGDNANIPLYAIWTEIGD